MIPTGFLSRGLVAAVLLSAGTSVAIAQSGAVTVYTSMAEPAIAAVEMAFETAYPDIDVTVLRLVTGNLTTRFASEAETGINSADVLIIATPVLFRTHPEWFVNMESAGIPNYDSWPEQFKQGNHAQALFGVNTIFYNTDNVSPEDAPNGWQDLLDPRWKGTSVMIDPASSETYMSWAFNMRKAFGDDFLAGLADQDLIIASGGLDAAQAVASGAADISFSAMSNQAEGLLAQGAPIGVLEVSGPALGNEHSIGIAANGPNPQNAKIFANWFLSAQGQSAGCIGTAASGLGEVEGCKALPPDFVTPSFDLPKAEVDEILALLGLS